MNKTPLEKAVDEFIAYCEGACKARQESNPDYCTSYTDRGRLCTDCPRDWSDELKEIIDEQEALASQPQAVDDPRQTKMPFAADDGDAEWDWDEINKEQSREQQCWDEMMGGHL
jgi:hypothetical protein